MTMLVNGEADMFITNVPLRKHIGEYVNVCELYEDNLAGTLRLDTCIGPLSEEDFDSVREQLTPMQAPQAARRVCGEDVWRDQPGGSRGALIKG